LTHCAAQTYHLCSLNSDIQTTRNTTIPIGNFFVVVRWMKPLLWSYFTYPCSHRHLR